ncbi:MAG: hypothetical protein IIY16_01485 [Oscillospiraceae bacterium]|nr:hypothetical protein [Oscillospiraceae bacterium]
MKVLLPRERGGEENFEIVSVNGRRDKLMKGVRVQVADAVSEVLLHRRLAMRAAERYLERVSAR